MFDLVHFPTDLLIFDIQLFYYINLNPKKAKGSN